MEKNLKDLDFALLKLLNDLKEALLATWRNGYAEDCKSCLLYTSPSPRDLSTSRMPSSA